MWPARLSRPRGAAGSCVTLRRQPARRNPTASRETRHGTLGGLAVLVGPVGLRLHARVRRSTLFQVTQSRQRSSGDSGGVTPCSFAARALWWRSADAGIVSAGTPRPCRVTTPCADRQCMRPCPSNGSVPGPSDHTLDHDRPRVGGQPAQCKKTRTLSRPRAPL